jgi:hypothetical protein
MFQLGNVVFVAFKLKLNHIKISASYRGNGGLSGTP